MFNRYNDCLTVVSLLSNQQFHRIFPHRPFKFLTGVFSYNLNVATAAARSLSAQIVRVSGGGHEDAGEAEEGLAGIAVAGVHGQGVAGDAGDIEVGDAVGVGLAGVAAVVGVAETDEVGVEPLAVVDHRLGRVGADVGGVGRAAARQSGARGHDGRSGLVERRVSG